MRVWKNRGMTIRPIIITGEPVLHRRAEPVEVIDDGVRELVADMYETMDAARGVGLAAPQVGVGLRIFTWQMANDDGIPPRGVVINPYLVSASKPVVGDPDPHEESEGCLSVPGESFPLRRGESATLTGLDLDGNEICATRRPAGSPGCSSTSTTTSTASSTSTGSRASGPARPRRPSRPTAGATPGLTWMPGEDRDPFGHDDDDPDDERSDEHVDGPTGRTRRRSTTARAADRVVVAVVGPTATGKSDLAVALAERLGGEVVGADASQLYRGMDIGTAKLRRAERRGVPHHQLDVLDVTEEAERRRVPAARPGRRRGRPRPRPGAPRRRRVGALRAGASSTGSTSRPPTRRCVAGSRSGPRPTARQPCSPSWSGSIPAAAAAIEPNNTRRIVRALEVVELTGRPFSATMPTREHLRPTVVVGLRLRPPGPRPAHRAPHPRDVRRRARRGDPRPASTTACGTVAPRAARSATPRRSPSSTAR